MIPLAERLAHFLQDSAHDMRQGDHTVGIYADEELADALEALVAKPEGAMDRPKVSPDLSDEQISDLVDRAGFCSREYDRQGCWTGDWIVSANTLREFLALAASPAGAKVSPAAESVSAPAAWAYFYADTGTPYTLGWAGDDERRLDLPLSGGRITRRPLIYADIGAESVSARPAIAEASQALDLLRELLDEKLLPNWLVPRAADIAAALQARSARPAAEPTDAELDALRRAVWDAQPDMEPAEFQRACMRAVLQSRPPSPVAPEPAAPGDQVRAAAIAANAHWNEFGPEHGFDEAMDRLHRALASPVAEITAPADATNPGEQG